MSAHRKLNGMLLIQYCLLARSLDNLPVGQLLSVHELFGNICMFHIEQE
jgi:hypothetical protein